MKLKRKPVSSVQNGCLMPLTIAVLAFLLLVSSLYLFPQFKASLGLKDLPTSFDEMRADKVMGYKTIEIRDSLLSESRRAEYLVVMEQDVSVDIEVSQMLWNISLFEKTKVIHAYGIGVFGIDLTDLKQEAIQVDHNIREVVLTLGETKLLYVENDHEKTTYEETEHALFAFGEIRLTAEQQTVVNKEIQDAMKEALALVSTGLETSKSARKAAEAFYEPLIGALAPGYDLVILQ
ncbi:MAG: DUF4230 domain-containing protein [Eubacteriales bacterium]|nr:DUF4230 domain-containing protein [Eubacteriales bacterium]MDD3863054.1 DUF4230 domain-containing protein [Eubacteriales bacterium]